MITPDKITEATTLADLARLLNAFGLMLTCKPVDGVAYEATCSDDEGVIGSCPGATLAEAIRFTFTDYVSNRWLYDQGMMAEKIVRGEKL